MQPTQAFCPACGAPARFRPGTRAAVCALCGALIAPGRRESLGRVEGPEDAGSPLSLEMEGEILDRPFVLAGHMQTRTALGACRDEWCLAFGDGLWGRLLEDQGRFVLLFPRDSEAALPAPESLEAGQGLELDGTGSWTVERTERIKLAGAEGELPWPLAPGTPLPRTELKGEREACACLETGNPVRLFMGRAVALEELRLRRAAPSFAGKRQIRVLDLNCPACGAGLALRAPDRTRRVACPVCASLLDASRNQLVPLESLKQGPPGFPIPLGAVGRIGDEEFTCVGVLRWRCVQPADGRWWHEYLLLDDARGFRRLLERDGHWSLLRDSPAPGTPEAGLRRFQDVELVLDGAWGEFPWDLTGNEAIRRLEFVRPPESLMAEVRRESGNEPRWARAEHLEGAEVWRAFKLPGEPPLPVGVGPHQPNPHWPRVHQMGLMMLAALAALLCIVMLASATHSEALLFRGTLDPSSRGSVLLSPPIAVQDGHRNLALRLLAPSSPELALEGALVSARTGEARSFAGSGQLFLSAVPPGAYVLRLAPRWEDRSPGPVTLELRSGVVRGLYPALALGVILLFPLLALLQAWAFEERRWLGSTLRTADSREAR